MTYEELTRLVNEVTGRPDVPIASYFMRTLANISRSGEYVEDTVTIYHQLLAEDWFVEAEAPNYLQVEKLIGTPDKRSIRRVMSVKLEGEEAVLVAPTSLVSLQALAKTCPEKPVAYYAAGTLKLAIPRSLLPHALDKGVQITLLTSNESMALMMASRMDQLPVGGNAPVEFPIPLADPDFIWQLHTCLDLVIMGIASGVLRYAGHEQEAGLAMADFMTGLRQFKADRQTQLIINEGALGY